MCLRFTARVACKHIAYQKVLTGYHHKSTQRLSSQKLLSCYHHQKCLTLTVLSAYHDKIVSAYHDKNYSAFITTKAAQRLSSQKMLNPKSTQRLSSQKYSALIMTKNYSALFITTKIVRPPQVIKRSRQLFARSALRTVVRRHKSLQF